jgi:hypothetical protein
LDAFVRTVERLDAAVLRDAVVVAARSISR